MSPELAVGLWILGLTGAGVVVWWLIRRFVASVDALDKEVGRVRELLPKFVEQSDLKAQMDRFLDSLTDMKDESTQREGRILDAISKVSNQQVDDTKQLRDELRTVHRRIDRIRRPAQRSAGT